MTRFFENMLDQARTLPGVESAAVTSYAPLQGESWGDLVSVENDTRPSSQQPSANLRFVSPGYFQTLHIALRAGRDFENVDRTRRVAIVSQSLARALWQNADPLGRTLMDNGKAHVVVGVVGDARSTNLDQTPREHAVHPVVANVRRIPLRF
ncbi:MAG: ABC transporter permease [Ignavibacteriota bacterium]